LAHAFALIEYPIAQPSMQVTMAATADYYRSLTPGDFEHATIFDILHPTTAGVNRAAYG
jgi:hypothetical protein